MNAVLCQYEPDKQKEDEPMTLDTHIPDFHAYLDWLREKVKDKLKNN